MYPDVVDLREFYESDLGLLARRLLRERLRLLWPDVTGLRVLGLGYTTPYLRPFLGEAERCFAFMPAPQGVTWWPREGPNATCLTEETALPLVDHAVDRLLIVHALENTEHIAHLLREALRVLAGNGRMIVVVPNRSGWWAHGARTPFGFGFSFSMPHIKRLLSNNGFQVTRVARALFTPPWTGAFPGRLLGQYAAAIEKQGSRFFPAFAGALVVEVTKQVYIKPLREKIRFAKPAFLNLPHLVVPTATPSPTRVEGGA